MKYVSRYRGPSMGLSQAAKGRLTQGIFGAVLGLGGYAILRQDELPTVEKLIGYGVTAVGAVILLDALGLPVATILP